MLHQVRHAAERQREGLQRRLASTEAALRAAEGSLAGSERERQGLSRRLALEGGRIRELESLLAELRAAHFRSLSAGGAAHTLTLAEGGPGGSPGAAPADQEVAVLRQQVEELGAARARLESALAAARAESDALAAALGFVTLNPKPEPKPMWFAG